MAQAGFTPISLYFSSTAAAVPIAGNLANGELALNIADMKLYAKNSSGVVTLLASNASTTGVDSLSFGSTGLTPSTATTGAITVAGTLNVANGGTGLTTLTASRIPYGAGTSALGNSSLFTFDGTQLLVNSNSTTTPGFFQTNDGTTTQANSFGTIVRNANDGDGRYSLSAWRAQNASNLAQFGYIGVQSVTGGSNYSPALVFGLSTGSGTYAEQGRWTTTGLSINSNVSRTKLFVASSNANDAITLGAVSGGFLVTNSNTNYGLQAGVFSTGNPWLQSMRTDGVTTTYDLCLQPSGGNVGIGTVSPSSKLHLSGINTTLTIQGTLGTGGTHTIGATGVNNTNLSITGASQIYLTANSADRFIIGSAGQLGIGAGNSTGTAGQVLTSGGSGAAPTWAAAGGGSQAFVAFGSTGGF